MAMVSYSATTGVVNFDGFVLTQKNPYYKNKYCKIKKPSISVSENPNIHVSIDKL